MNNSILFAAAAAGLAALAVVYLVKTRAKSEPVRYNGNVFADRETALMFKDQERLFQAF